MRGRSTCSEQAKCVTFCIEYHGTGLVCSWLFEANTFKDLQFDDYNFSQHSVISIQRLIMILSGRC